MSTAEICANLARRFHARFARRFYWAALQDVYAPFFTRHVEAVSQDAPQRAASGFVLSPTPSWLYE